MITFKQTFLLTLCLGLAILASFLTGYLIRDHQISGNDLPILLEARDLILKYGITEPPEKSKLEYGMIQGMIQAYGDPYTSFSEPVEHELTTNTLEGQYGGIGVQLMKDGQNYTILIPLPDSPAELNGILEGDRLIKIDDLQVTSDTSIESVQAAIRGTVGTKIHLVIERPPDFKPFEFDITRTEFSIPSVNGFLALIEPKLGIIKVNVMAATTPEEILNTVASLQERGAEAFALDLRDNFGGLLTSGIDTARLFLNNGTILQEKYKDQDIKSYKVDKEGKLADLRLVVLVNRNTASAAEIAAGALQKLKNIKLIGEPTYGKDTVQLVFELRDKSSLQVSAAKWWIPDASGTIPPSISGSGLQPDILIDLNLNSSLDPALLAATEYFFSNP